MNFKKYYSYFLILIFVLSSLPALRLCANCINKVEKAEQQNCHTQKSINNSQFHLKSVSTEADDLMKICYYICLNIKNQKPLQAVSVTNPEINMPLPAEKTAIPFILTKVFLDSRIHLPSYTNSYYSSIGLRAPPL